jgi:hypothetical protein
MMVLLCDLSANTLDGNTIFEERYIFRRVGRNLQEMMPTALK